MLVLLLLSFFGGDGGGFLVEHGRRWCCCCRCWMEDNDAPRLLLEPPSVVEVCDSGLRRRVQRLQRRRGYGRCCARWAAIGFLMLMTLALSVHGIYVAAASTTTSMMPLSSMALSASAAVARRHVEATIKVSRLLSFLRFFLISGPPFATVVVIVVRVARFEH